MDADAEHDPREEEIRRQDPAAIREHLVTQEALRVLKPIGERIASKSLATSNAYADAQDMFVDAAVPRLPKEALDELFQVSRRSVRQHSSVIRAWARRWKVDTYGMRVWATDQTKAWQAFGPQTSVVPRGGHRRTMIFTPRFFKTKKEYLDAVMAWAKEQWDISRHIDEGPVKRMYQIKEKCEWLARYQVGGERFTAIARSVERERQSVTEAVENMARLLELPLRSARVGRPKK